MSKFFSTGDSDSEDSEVYSDESEEEEVGGGFGANRFIYSSSESEEEKRVVRSAKDKRFDEMLTTIKAMKNHMKINDWTSIQKDFDALNKQLEKAKQVVAKEGVPKFYFKAIKNLDDFSRDTFANKEAKKKMSKPNAQALNSMKQTIKKTATKYEKEMKDYEKSPLVSEDDIDEEESPKAKTAAKKQIKAKPTKKKADSDESEEESDEESEESSDDDKPKKKTAAKKVSKKHDSDDDFDSEDDEEEDDDDDDEDSDSDSGSEIDISNKTSGAQFTREFWVKKEFRKDAVSESESASEDSDDERQRRRKREEKALKAKEAGLKNAELREVKEAEDAVKSKADAAQKEKEELTPEAVVKRLKELLSMRGKRGTDRMQLLVDLRILAQKATEPAAKLKVSTTLAASLFDVTLNKGTYMPISLWQECLTVVDGILTQLKNNPSVRLSEDEKVDDTFEEEAAAAEAKAAAIADGTYDPSAETTPAAKKGTIASPTAEQFTADGTRIHYVIGSLVSFVQNLVREFRQSLLNIDPHSLEYVERLKDETPLVAVVGKAQEYYHSIGKAPLESKVALLHLELVYYRYRSEHDALRLQLEKDANSTEATEQKEKMAASSTTTTNTPLPTFPYPYTSPTDEKIKLTVRIKDEELVVPRLATFLYKNADDKARLKAIFLHSTWLSIHNRYTEARELILMSRAQEIVHDMTDKTRILYNRAIAQLGLAAFRHAEFRHALDCLAELHQSNKIKELLAQGVSMNRWQDRDAEQEALDRRRQFPFHMHLNQDTLEAAHLISAMLFEVPNLALHGQANKRRVISKVFRRLYEHHQRQAFNGPPENTRDLIMAATRTLRLGDWENTFMYINKLRVWDALAQAIGSRMVVSWILLQLKRRIQEEALRTHLLTYSTNYTSVRLQSLCDMFELPATMVHRITSKLMVNEQLQGAWDQPNALIVMHSHHPTKLQKSAQSFADKASLFLELNERLLESRWGGQEQQDGQGHERGERGGRGGRGGKQGYTRHRGEHNEGGLRGRGRGRGRGGRGRSNNNN